MPKPIIKSQSQAGRGDILSPSGKSEQKKRLSQADKLRLDRILRLPRSKNYIEAVHRLDAGGHVHNQELVREIIDAVKNEYPDADLSSFLGLVSICRLGVPYEVHILDFCGGILVHYKSGQVLPGGLEKARAIAMYGGYAFIEVYTDCCRAVAEDGEVSVIPDNK